MPSEFDALHDENASWLDRIQVRTSFSAATNNKLYNGSSKVANPTNVTTEFQQWSVSVLYQQDARRRWSFNLPYMQIEQRDNSGVLDRTAGLGDLSVIHSWRLGDEGRWEVLGGLELPTGKELDTPAPGVVPPSLLQPGSGTWDPILGLRWNHPGPGPLYQSAHVVGILPIGESDAGLDPGNIYQAQYSLGWQMNSTFFATLGVEGLHRTPDALLGTKLINSSSTFYSLRPGVMINLDSMSLFVGARVPFAFQVDDTQIAPGTFWEIWLSAN